MAERSPARLVAFLSVWVLVCGSTSPLFATPQQQTSTAESPSATELNNRGVSDAQAGRFEQGAAWLRQALERDPLDAAARKNLSGVLTDWAARLSQEGHTDRAITLLQEATQRDPGNGKAWVALGDLLYLARHEFDAAVAAWTQAHGALPASAWDGVATRIAHATRDRLIERTFATVSTAHFDVRTQRGATDPRTTLLERTLEETYARLAADVDGAPARLTVLVYAEEDFQRLTLNRDWMLGFYDGRIRLRWREVDSPVLPWLVAHELGHALLQHRYGHRVPVWVHEGYAQVCEGPHARSDEEQRLEELVRARTRWVPLKWLDPRFTHPADREDVASAYVEARVAVETLLQRYGRERMKRFLGHLASGTPIESAYDDAFAPARWANTDRGIFE